MFLNDAVMSSPRLLNPNTLDYLEKKSTALCFEPLSQFS